MTIISPLTADANQSEVLAKLNRVIAVLNNIDAFIGPHGVGRRRAYLDILAGEHLSDFDVLDSEEQE